LEYYSISGESDNCPPNLNEFVCYLKKTETHPVSRACGEESIWKRYKYTLINTLNESVYIAESEMKTSYGETTTSTYFENVASPGLCGLVSKVLVSLDGEPSGHLTFEYKFEDNMRISIVTLTGFDGKSTTKIETQDLYSGNLISKVDHEGLETRYTYNQSGQYTAIEVAPDTDRYAIKRFDYDYTQGNNSLLITGSKGHQQKYIYDGMGREVYHLSQDEFGDFQAINETHYDAEGRVAYSIERDWYNGEPVEYQTQYYYSLFGELDYTVLPNGNLLLSHFNPVKLTSITGTEGLSYDIVEHDINGKPVKESRFTPEGQLYSSSQRFYDSHGQTIKATDPLGYSSYYSYDYLGRSLTVTDPTNTVKSLEYAPNSADPLIAKIRVAGRVVGERTYDGLQRIVAETQGEVITSYSYRDNQTSPSEQSSSQQPTWSFDYDPLLKKNIRASTNSTLLTFEYDSSTGKLVGSKNENSKNSYQYDNQGRLIKEIRTINDEKYESTYAYSFLG
ncbi:RHS repeat protein, partial [Vibrio genomosp. F10]